MAGTAAEVAATTVEAVEADMVAVAVITEAEATVATEEAAVPRMFSSTAAAGDRAGAMGPAGTSRPTWSRPAQSATRTVTASARS